MPGAPSLSSRGETSRLESLSVVGTNHTGRGEIRTIEQRAARRTFSQFKYFSNLAAGANIAQPFHQPMDRDILNYIVFCFFVAPVCAACLLFLVWTYGVLD